MFTLWRKFELAETAYFRPLASYSSNSLTNFKQIDVTKKEHETGALEVALKSATNPLQVLSTLPSNPSEFRTLSSETVIHTLQTISVLHRTNKDHIKCDFITSHPNFEQLCRRLKRCSNLLTADEMVDSLKFLCSLGVQTNSEISMILLNLIKHEINNLSMEKIIYLDYLLKKTECRSELQKAIKTSLPIVFELQLPQQIDKDSRIHELINILNFFTNHIELDNKNENLTIVCKILCDKFEQINSSDVINIIYSLCAIDRFHLPNYIKLITKCIRYLMDHINDIEINELLKVINRLVSKTVNQFSPFQYHIHSLLKSCAERISQHDMGLQVAVSLQRILKNISFQNTVLLRYISDRMVVNVDGCQSMSSFEVFTIIQAFSNNYFIPQTTNDNDIDDKGKFWSEKILPALLKNEHLAQIQPSNYVWLPFTLQLAVLGHFSQELISRVLSESYLKAYTNRKDLSIKDLYKILVLYQTASMQPNLDMTDVDVNKISEICKTYMEQTPPCDVQLDLIDHLGRECVLSNVRTKHMHLIPTLVKLNKETGQFESFGEDLRRDKDGFIPLDTVPYGKNEMLICVDSIKRYHLFSNVTSKRNLPGLHEVTEDMKIGTFRLRPKQLESLGISVCEINYRRYNNVRMGNKFRYLNESIIRCRQKAFSTFNENELK